MLCTENCQRLLLLRLLVMPWKRARGVDADAESNNVEMDISLCAEHRVSLALLHGNVATRRRCLLVLLFHPHTGRWPGMPSVPRMPSMTRRRPVPWMPRRS